MGRRNKYQQKSVSKRAHQVIHWSCIRGRLGVLSRTQLGVLSFGWCPTEGYMKRRSALPCGWGSTLLLITFYYVIFQFM